MDDKHFCPLCSKYVEKKDSKNVQAGPVNMNICVKCDIVLHNLNVILGRARDKIQKEKEKIIKETSSNIVIPGRN